MEKVVIYTTAVCPYCQMAKQLLTAKGVAFTEIRVDQDAALKEEMIARSGRRTVPQIFINKKSIGGFDDLAALEKEGRIRLSIEPKLT